MEFGEVEPAKPAVTPLRATEPTPPTDAALSDMQHATQNQEALEIDEARIKEDRLKHMLIENPLGAEELILSGELEDEEEGEDADE